MGCSNGKSAGIAKPKEEVNQAVLPATDSDGTATDRALAQLKLIFDKIDANTDGAISKAELAKALHADTSLVDFIKDAGFNPKFSVLDQLDTNNDGYVTWEEFRTHLKVQAVAEVEAGTDLKAAEVPAKEKALAQLREVFKGLDANADAAVSKEELSAALKEDERLVTLMKDADLNPEFFVLEQLDTNEDGKVTWEEFEANLYKAALQEVKATGDVAAALPPPDKTAGAAEEPEFTVEGESSFKMCVC